MKKIAVFPGSFDPITMGHYSIIKRALPLFDEVVVALGVNSNKAYMFSLERRFEMVNQAFKDEPNIRIETYEGLTVDFCNEVGAQYIIRGLRNAGDFEFEKNIAHMNAAINKNIETITLVTDPALSPISSTIVREIIRNNGDVAQFLPPNVTI